MALISPVVSCWGNCLEYLHMTDHDDSGIGFLSLLTTQIYRTFAMESPHTPKFLPPIAGEGMKGTGEIAG